MSHALLLRLFLSPYFSISVAMHYLKTYAGSIGISHYLCWRMRGMSADEVESYWPQICHLLITYPTQSNALESFVLQRAEESTHSAMLTFWFMQAALRDLAPTRQTNPRPFLICQRVLHRCHGIIFGDPPSPASRSPYRSLPASPALGGSANGGNDAAAGAGARAVPARVNAHALPALVGMGVVLAAQGIPQLRETAGEWAVMQGRQPRDDEAQGRERAEGEEGAPNGRRVEKVSHGEEPVQGEDSDDRAQARMLGTPIQAARTVPDLVSTPRLSTDAHIATPHPRGSPLLHTPPADINPFSSDDMDECLPSTPRAGAFTPSSASAPNGPRAGAGVVVAPSTPRTTSTPGHQHFHSFPDLSRLHTPDRPASAGPAGRNNLRTRLYPHAATGDQPVPPELLLAGYSLAKQRQLLKSHYTRSEIRFLLLLEDISNRLLVVPKPARVSALRAELTSLNHNLPAEVCMPLWCSADHAHDSPPPASALAALSPASLRPTRRVSGSGVGEDAQDKGKRGHSRVVRISPGDSVVLNSAERAPFLLHVEILEGDLDFDPARRENRELLRKIVAHEDARRRKKESGSEGVAAAVFPAAEMEVPRRGVGLGIDGFGSPMPDSVPASRALGGDSPAQTGSQYRDALPAAGARRVSKRRDPPPEIDVEEVDLVEQLYGARLSVRDTLPELADSLPLPSGPKNKALDMAAWDRAEAPASSRRPSYAPPGTGGGLGVEGEGDMGAGSSASSPGLAGRASMAMDTDADADAARAVEPGTQSQGGGDAYKRVITLEDYSERMRTAAVMLAQLNASLVPAPQEAGGGRLSWLPGTGWILGNGASSTTSPPASAAVPVPLPGPAGPFALPPDVPGAGAGGKGLRLAAAQAEAIRGRIMEEMMALEEERVARMTARPVEWEGRGSAEGAGEGEVVLRVQSGEGGEGTAEDEGIVRRELNKADPSAAVFKESWDAKKARIRSSSPWGHLANWDVISVIVKTGTDLRQEQLATQLIERFGRIFREEKCDCWVRAFRILITGEQSGLVETITDAVSVHSIKKGEYARRLAEGGPMGRVSLLDHFISTYGKPDSGRFARAQRAFIRSLAGYSVVTYLLQIKDRHNGNILVDRDGHVIHIDFGFMLSNSPGGNMGFEAAPFKLPLEYVEIMGGLESAGWKEFKRVFKEGFEAARKHSDSLITMVELMQKDSKLDCFVLFGDQTAHHFRERFALGLTTAAVDAHLERLVVSSMGSNYTRLYDTFQYYSQGVL